MHTGRRMKRESTDWNKIFGNHIYNKKTVHQNMQKILKYQ